MFESSLKAGIPYGHAEDVQNRRIEGTRLSVLTQTDTERSKQEVFTKYFMMFSRRNVFTPSMAPFSNWIYGPDWFKIELPTLNVELQVEVVEI